MLGKRRAVSSMMLSVVLLLPFVSTALFPPNYPPQCVQWSLAAGWSFIANNDGLQCIGAPAYGHYNASRYVIGWDQLTLETAAQYPDAIQAYGAGFFEGAATAEVTQDFYHNMIAPVQYNASITQYFTENLAWMNATIVSGNHTHDPYWEQVGLMWEQFQGFLDGLNSQITDPTKKFTHIMLLYLASQGDLCDLSVKYPANPGANDWRKMRQHTFEMWLAKHSHCSLLTRVAPDHSDIFFGHATWQTFTFSLRIFKTLTFRYSTAVAKTIQFSSYPATFVSTDDFHVLDSGLVVMETSLNVFNTSIYSHVVPQGTLLSWIRVMVANRVAVDGPTWAHEFSRHNSGTYNNEWAIVDLNRFTPGHPTLNPGLLTVVDQMPGWVMSADKTTLLDGPDGYFPSYNVPYFTEIYDYAGYPAAVQAQGPQMLDYNTCVRAKMFKQRAPNTSTVADMQWLLQYNDYEHDPISAGNPLYAIAARVDLTPKAIGAAQAFGGIDAKVSSFQLFHDSQKVLAWAGPTPQQPIFSFLNTTASISGPHVGVPNSFNFGFQTFQVNAFDAKQRGK